MHRQSIYSKIGTSLWTIVFLCSFFNNWGQITPIHVDYNDAIPHEYLPHSSIDISDRIAVVRDSLDLLSYRDVVDVRNWSGNDLLEIKRTGAYWIRFDIASDRMDTLLVEFGQERLSTWGHVNFYVQYEDSLVQQGVTGIHVPLNEKAIRIGVNLTQLVVYPGTTRVLAKLTDYLKLSDDPNWSNVEDEISSEIKVFVHDPNTYTTLEAYRFPGYFKKGRRGYLFDHNYIQRNLETYTDTTGHMSIKEIDEHWDQVARHNYMLYPHSDSTYWMRMKIAGDTESSGTYMLAPSSGSKWNFDTIRLYFQTQSGRWYHMISGNKVKNIDQTVSSPWNLFKINVAPNDTATLYFKMTGAGRRFIPSFSVAHIDESSFWSSLFQVQWIHGGFVCVLICTVLYFLILGFTEKGASHNLWFVSWIAGFVLLLGFLGNDVNYFLFQEREHWHPWIVFLGGMMLSVGILEYIIKSIDVQNLFGYPLEWRYLLYLFILGARINFVNSFYLYEGDMVMSLGSTKLLLISGLFFFILSWLIALYEYQKGNKGAIFFLIAFGVFLIILVIRFYFSFGAMAVESGYNEDLRTWGAYWNYWIYAAIAMTIILLAFGNGYRINQLKLQATEASVRSEQNQEVARILKEKNSVINNRAEENALLVREIHHRVKNNLQVLASLLSLQSDYISEKTAYDAIIESKARVESMGLVHQMLYMGKKGFASVYMPDYIDQLTGYFEDGYSADQSIISFHTDVQISNLDLDTAIPIALTITELVTNAVKHGINGRDDGQINIRLWISAEDKLNLEVSDNGVGLKTSSDEDKSTFFGTELIRILSKKLKGKVTVTTEKGYSTLIEYGRFTHYAQVDK